MKERLLEGKYIEYLFEVLREMLFMFSLLFYVIIMFCSTVTRFINQMSKIKFYIKVKLQKIAFVLLLIYFFYFDSWFKLHQKLYIFLSVFIKCSTRATFFCDDILLLDLDRFQISHVFNVSALFCRERIWSFLPSHVCWNERGDC